MKVKLLTPRCGERFVQNAGDVVELDDAEALRLIERGSAEPVKAAASPAPPPVPRTASAPPPPRTAAKPRPSKAGAR
jgi:hypothetical protein